MDGKPPERDLLALSPEAAADLAPPPVTAGAVRPVSEGGTPVEGSVLSAEQLEHACDPFFSARDSGRSRGLGLAKARQYARLHGGDLTLVSTPDHGTTATIAIPEWRSLSASRSRAAA